MVIRELIVEINSSPSSVDWEISDLYTQVAAGWLKSNNNNNKKINEFTGFQLQAEDAAMLVVVLCSRWCLGRRASQQIRVLIMHRVLKHCTVSLYLDT